MHSINREQIWKYIHVGATMKHVHARGQKPALSWPERSAPVREHIECVNQSQKNKWREYAQANTRRNSSPSRAEFA